MKTSTRSQESRGISPEAVRQIISRKTTEVITACGCVTVPGAIIGLGDGSEVQCKAHGWQKIVRNATFSEIAGLTEQPPLPEFPPF